jgi:hypothetical protein
MIVPMVRSRNLRNYRRMQKVSRYSSSDILFLFVILTDILFFVFLFSVFDTSVFAGIGANVTVNTKLTVGAVAPDIMNVTIQASAGNIDLTANATTRVVVEAIIRDYNGDDDVINVSAEFFDLATSSYGAIDDNNRHYTNQSCEINRTFGDAYHVNATCYFYVWYYANNATWNATVFVRDNSSRNDTEYNVTAINSLLAVGLPEQIDYGTVNATEVSDEKIANVTNFGNVLINLTLEGYGAVRGDNLSMNCTLGFVQNISVHFEKFNLTSSNVSSISFSQMSSIYTNLTGNRSVWRFNQNYRQNDTSAYLDETNATYWRIYVPVGVAGTCGGNIIFGAAVQSGT